MLVTIDTANQMLDQLKTRGAALLKIRERIERAIKARAGQLEAERKKALATAPGGEPLAGAVAKEFMRRMTASATRELLELRKRHVEETAVERQAVLELLSRYETDLDQTEPLVNPVSMLARAGLGNERRTHLQHQLQGIGPAGLRNHAAAAVAAGDRELAAAVLSIAETDSKRYRGSVDIHELARAMMGAEHKALERLLAELRLAVGSLRVIDKAIVTGATSSTDKIELGLASHALNPSPDHVVAVDDVPGTGRIRRGLADRTE